MGQVKTYVVGRTLVVLTPERVTAMKSSVITLEHLNRRRPCGRTDGLPWYQAWWVWTYLTVGAI